MDVTEKEGRGTQAAASCVAVVVVKSLGSTVWSPRRRPADSETVVTFNAPAPAKRPCMSTHTSAAALLTSAAPACSAWRSDQPTILIAARHGATPDADPPATSVALAGLSQQAPVPYIHCHRPQLRFAAHAAAHSARDDVLRGEGATGSPTMPVFVGGEEGKREKMGGPLWRWCDEKHGQASRTCSNVHHVLFSAAPGVGATNWSGAMEPASANGRATLKRTDSARPVGVRCQSDAEESVCERSTKMAKTRASAALSDLAGRCCSGPGDRRRRSC